jgi:hypothetical protein
MQTSVLSHVCLVTASNGQHSSASELTPLQGGNHLTLTSYSDRWLEPILSSAASSWLGQTSKCQLQTFSCQFSTGFWAELTKVSLMDHIGNTASNSCSTVFCICCIAMSLILLCVTQPLLSSDSFFTSPNPALSKYAKIYIIFKHSVQSKSSLFVDHMSCLWPGMKADFHGRLSLKDVGQFWLAVVLIDNKA